MTPDADRPPGEGRPVETITRATEITATVHPRDRCVIACSGDRCATACIIPTDLHRIADALETLADCVLYYESGGATFGVSS